jgi:hypothetical protein
MWCQWEGRQTEMFPGRIKKFQDDLFCNIAILKQQSGRASYCSITSGKSDYKTRFYVCLTVCVI